MKNITWQQLSTLAICFTAIVLTHIFASPEVGAVTAIVSTVVAAIMRSLADPPPPSASAPITPLALPVAKATLLLAAIMALVIAGCNLFNQPQVRAFEDFDQTIDRCEYEARDAVDGGHIAAYNACMKDAGLK